MNKITSFSLASAVVLGVFACGDDKDSSIGPQVQSYDYGPMLTNFTNNVVIATYGDLDAATADLLSAVKALRADASAANLWAARAAWTAARAPWEASEGFLFGPVDFNGYDPAMDSWPVNRTDLDAVLASSNSLNSGYVASLDGSLKGFHTIEYLLFDEGGSKTPEQFDERQFEYLVSATEDFKATTNALYTSWLPSGGNYGSKVINAGNGSNVYPSQQAAVQEIVNAMVGICDEVANGKIADPFVEQDTRLVESQFSYNSLTDFQNNIRSVWNAYTGDYRSEGTGLDEFVALRDSALDERFKTEIGAAITSIASIDHPFRAAISTDASNIEAAQRAIARVQQTLEEDILPLVLQ